MKKISFDGETISLLDRILRIPPELHGQDYLEAIARKIWEEFGFAYIFIGHAIRPDNLSVQTVVTLKNGVLSDNFMYDLDGTPCENVFTGQRVCIHTSGVALSFPEDTMLVTMGVESYIGAPTILGGELFGLVAILDPDTIDNPEFYRSLIDFIASRVSLELERHIHKAELEALTRQATTDHLTGLLNRSAFASVLETVRPTAHSSVMMFVDGDDFKVVNDTHGHDKGDEVLRMIADVLSTSVRGGDVVCRYGGEEFLIFMPKTDHHMGTEVANRIHKQLKQNTVYPVTVSIGFTVGSDDESIEDMISRADQALYAAKNGGKNQTCYIQQALK